MKYYCLIIFFSLLATPIAQANGLFRAESETLFSSRKDEKNSLELPFFEFMSTSYMNEKRNFEFNSNFSFFTNPTQAQTTKAKLYILDAKFEVIPELVNVRIGRSFDTQNAIGAASIDMVSAELILQNKQLHMGSFVGVERKPETSSPNPNATLWGAHINYNSGEALPYFITTKFVQHKNNSVANPVENLAQFSFKKPFAAAWSPEFITDSVTNISKSNLDRLEMGFYLYPSANSFAKIRFLTYDVLPDSGVEQPIYSIFSQGRLYEGRIQLEKKINQSWVVSVSTFFDNYLLQHQTNTRTSGYGAEFATKFHGDGTNIANTVYFFKSYGGSVYGNRIHLQKGAFVNQEFYAGADISYYQKITSSKRFASSTEFGWSRILGKQFKFNFGGEFNSNNLLKYDLRAVAKLTFLLWSET